MLIAMPIQERKTYLCLDVLIKTLLTQLAKTKKKYFHSYYLKQMIHLVLRIAIFQFQKEKKALQE